MKGKRETISGSGNVVIELEGAVESLWDSKGSFIVQESFPRACNEIIAAKASSRAWSRSSKPRPSSTHVGQHKIALHCATPNEDSEYEAKALVEAGCLYLAEGSNMGSSKEAIDDFGTATDKGVLYAPGKAGNCGGGAFSGLEMAENSQRVNWSVDEVDGKLKDIMYTCFDTCYETAVKYSVDKGARLFSLLEGANISGLIKVVDAMFNQGDLF